MVKAEPAGQPKALYRQIVARATYAAYNRGPSHLPHYWAAKQNPESKKVDDAFWDKFQTVSSGRELEMQRCYQNSCPGFRGTPAVHHSHRPNYLHSDATGFNICGLVAQNAVVSVIGLVFPSIRPVNNIP